MTTTQETRLAVVDATGKVVNTIIAGSTYKDPDGHTVHPHDTAEIGWSTTDGGATFVAPPPTAAELIAYADAKQNKLLAQVWSFAVGSVTLTTKLDTAGQNAMLKLGMWGQWNAATGFTEPYSNVDFTSASLTASQASYMAIQACGIVSKTFTSLNLAAQQIASGQITSFAQVDALAWPTP